MRFAIIALSLKSSQEHFKKLFYSGKLGNGFAFSKEVFFCELI